MASIITQNPRFTIGLPIVKTEFVEETIVSILNQSYGNFELVIVNNAKTIDKKDEIKKIAQKYTDTRIKYFENKTQMPMVDNWNTVLSYANGEYFAICCDDDTYEEEFLSEIDRLIRKYPLVNIFKSRVRLIDHRNNVIALGEINREFESNIEFVWGRVVSKRVHYLSEFVCKTEELKINGGFVDFFAGWGSDTFTWFKMAMTTGICSSDRFLSGHRIATSNASTSSSIIKRLDAIVLFQNIFISYLNKVNIETGVDKLLIEDVKKNLPKYLQARKSTLVNIKANNSGLLSLVIFLMKNRKKYSISMKMVLISIGKKFINV